MLCFIWSLLIHSILTSPLPQPSFPSKYFHSREHQHLSRQKRYCYTCTARTLIPPPCFPTAGSTTAFTVGSAPACITTSEICPLTSLFLKRAKEQTSDTYMQTCKLALNGNVQGQARMLACQVWNCSVLCSNKYFSLISNVTKEAF